MAIGLEMMADDIVVNSTENDATPGDDVLMFVGDFEHGIVPLTKTETSSPWYAHGNAPVVVTAPEPVRHGRFSMKSVLDRDKSPVSYRTEVIPFLTEKRQSPQLGEDYWYGFSIYFPADWTDDNIWEIVAQWHGVPDRDLGEVSRNPVIAFHSDGRTLKITNIWDTARHTQKAQQKREARYSGGATLWEAPIRKVHWTDWVIHVKWSFKDDGLVEIWENGKQVAKRSGPNTFNDKNAPFFKLGIYKGWRHRRTPAGKVRRRVIYHDEVRFAGPHGTYDDVAPPSRTPSS